MLPRSPADKPVRRVNFSMDSLLDDEAAASSAGSSRASCKDASSQQSIGSFLGDDWEAASNSNEESIANTEEEEEVRLTERAMQLSERAALFLQGEQYEECLAAYQQAAACYEKEAYNNNSLLATVNAASCYRNMGAVCRIRERYDDALLFLKQAHELYTTCAERAFLERADPDSSAASVPADLSTTTLDQLCLEAMALETLLSTAHLHLEYQQDAVQAVQCCEQVLSSLLQTEQMCNWDDLASYSAEKEGLVFVPLSKEQHTELLLKTLENLGTLYRTVGYYEADLTCLEEAVALLQQRQKESPQDDVLADSVTEVMRNLSELYFERGMVEDAVDALYQAMAIKLSSSEPNAEAIEVMEKMGLASEQMGNYQKALQCYEKALRARTQLYGNCNPAVAKLLVDSARVIERMDGSSKDSIDLYRTANEIYAMQVQEQKDEEEKEDFQAMLDGVHKLLRQGQHVEAVGVLCKCLAYSEEGACDVTLDKGQIYFDLGKAYMGMGDFQAAQTCLVRAIQEVGSVTDEDAFPLLQHIEFLEKEQQQNLSMTAPSVDLYGDPTFCIEDSQLVAGEPTVSFRESLVGDPTVSFRDISAETRHGSSDDSDHDLTIKTSDFFAQQYGPYQRVKPHASSPTSVELIPVPTVKSLSDPETIEDELLSVGPSKRCQQPGDSAPTTEPRKNLFRERRDSMGPSPAQLPYRQVVREKRAGPMLCGGCYAIPEDMAELVSPVKAPTPAEKVSHCVRFMQMQGFQFPTCKKQTKKVPKRKVTPWIMFRGLGKARCHKAPRSARILEDVSSFDGTADFSFEQSPSWENFISDVAWRLHQLDIGSRVNQHVHVPGFEV